MVANIRILVNRMMTIIVDSGMNTVTAAMEPDKAGALRPDTAAARENRAVVLGQARQRDSGIMIVDMAH